MKILLVTATVREWEPIRVRLHSAGFKADPSGILCKKDLEVAVLVTGIGMMMTAAQLSSQYAIVKPDLSINAGIAGSYQAEIELGSVVNVITEQVGDLGVQHRDGRFSDLFQEKLIDANSFPFTEGKLVNPASDRKFLPNKHGLTLNTSSGFGPTIERIKNKYHADVETMEGAAFFYVNLLHEVPFLELRSISNYVIPRDRSTWVVEMALAQLSETIVEMLEQLTGQ